MASDQLQPLNSIGTMEDVEAGRAAESQAQKDYRTGREALKNEDFTLAVISFHNALKGFEQAGDEQGVANAADRLGDTCLGREEYQAALDHYQRALEICLAQDDSFSQASLQKKMAACHRKLGNHARALDLLFDLTDHYQTLRDPRGTVEVLIVIAETYVEMEEPEKAADTYRTVASIHANFKHSRLADEFNRRADALVAP